jgi:hypothetical protein
MGMVLLTPACTSAVRPMLRKAFLFLMLGVFASMPGAGRLMLFVCAAHLVTLMHVRGFAGPQWLVLLPSAPVATAFLPGRRMLVLVVGHARLFLA